jgi:hypothetical protein
MHEVFWRQVPSSILNRLSLFELFFFFALLVFYQALHATLTQTCLLWVRQSDESTAWGAILQVQSLKSVVTGRSRLSQYFRNLLLQEEVG